MEGKDFSDGDTDLRESEFVMMYRNKIIGKTLIILKEKEGKKRFLVFPLGLHAAGVIEMAAKNKTTARPMTHDLILSLIDALESEMTRVVMTKVDNDFLHSEIHVRRKDEDRILIGVSDDAMVFALKKGVPILVKGEVLDTFGATFEQIVERGKALNEIDLAVKLTGGKITEA
jgi:bifunctional DNase/RNase